MTEFNMTGRIQAKVILIEPRHDKTNIMGPRSLISLIRIQAVRLPSRETDREQHGSLSDCADAQAGLDPCWSQMHYVGFVMTRLNYNHSED
jgi:hypothetical protein